MAKSCDTMKKEIGSIFTLNNHTLLDAQQGEDYISSDVNQYSLCREALYDIAINQTGSNKKVLIPAYTCQTVITPFEEAGWTCFFYNVNKDLRIDIKDLQDKTGHIKPSLVVAHPYFGMDLNQQEIELFQNIHNKGIRIIIDLTQCIFSSQALDFVDYYVGSYRKWFPIPDGGFLINNTNTKINQPQCENNVFVTNEIDAMYLRDLYFRSEDQRLKDISIRLSKTADAVAEVNINPHRMSKVSCFLLRQCDEVSNQQNRIANFTYLYSHISENEKLEFVCHDLNNVTTAPLYFTLFVNERNKLQKLLSLNSIYAPVLWPVEDERVLVSEDIKFIYNHLLAIPCDQRYDLDDMQRIVEVINNY